MIWSHEVFEAVTVTDPARRFVAVIRRGDHLASFTFASTKEEAERKAVRAVWAFHNPKEAKAGDYPPDLDSLVPAETEEAI